MKITIKDLMLLLNVSYSTAQRNLKNLKKKMGTEIVNVYQVSYCYGIPLEAIREKLKMEIPDVKDYEFHMRAMCQEV